MPWIDSKIGSTTYRILRQDDLSSCGYCCVGMVIRLLDGGGYEPSEITVKNAGKSLNSQAYSRATQDIPGAQATPLIADPKLLPNFGEGTYGSHLADVLDQGIVRQDIAAQYYGYQSQAALKGAMRAASKQNPLIVLVKWKLGGGHWVVVVGRAKTGLGKSSIYTLLDPQGFAIQNTGSSKYGEAGTFTGHYISAEKRQSPR